MTATLHTREGRTVSLEPWCLMGILNVTPDSFSDGGRHLDPSQALAFAGQMVADGATIIDVGGESTRPGARRVDAAEQIRRVVPVIEGLRSVSPVTISVDTTLAAVASAAIDAGADLVNDVSAGLDDPGMFEVVAKRACGMILMHRLSPPEEDQYSTRYDTPPVYHDLLGEVAAFLEARAAAAEAAGIAPGAIAIDPGLGFGKTVEQNLALARGLEAFTGLGRPVLVGASRKSFLGALAGAENPEGREAASVAFAVEAWRRGASILRVHEPRPHREALAVAEALVG
ncbi:MAG: dihydropteroate synthase [Phycisphaerales bacterium]|nr:dihydropteroate synthase [Phycisphaerales bacterium]